ncbi:hypothetical protein V6X02_02265 [Spiribacter sp. 1M153]|uniref:type IV pilus modification PilV family protein n=1 Tax=Spiribacter roseus TaxID=1855875 RepID=UPI00349F2D74
MRSLSRSVPPYRQTGSSLVEVLAASSLLAMGVLGLVMGQSRASLDLRQMHEHVQAQFLAMDLAEQARAYRPGPLPASRLIAWRERVAEQLPRGEARVQWPGPPPTPGTLTITWRVSDRSDSGSLHYVFRP